MPLTKKEIADIAKEVRRQIKKEEEEEQHKDDEEYRLSVQRFREKEDAKTFCQKFGEFWYGVCFEGYGFMALILLMIYLYAMALVGLEKLGLITLDHTHH